MRSVPALLVAALAVVLGACSVGTASSSRPMAPSQAAGPAATTDLRSGLPIVHVADLPPEAATTLALISTGGPFPYRQDGAVFQNREGILPSRAAGHYREYTVPTPGEGDRGARRIVTGADGERYWTADHYASFAWIAP